MKNNEAARRPLPATTTARVMSPSPRVRVADSRRTVALLGTRFTMKGPFYPTVCERYGVTVVAPNAPDRIWIHERYVNELLKGEFREDTRAQFTSLVGRLRDDAGVDGVILGGTELPLLLPDAFIAEISSLDTTALHVAAIVRRLRQAHSV